MNQFMNELLELVLLSDFWIDL